MRYTPDERQFSFYRGNMMINEWMEWGTPFLKFYTVLCQLLFVRDLRANGKMVGPQGISQPKEYCNCANSMDRETR